MRQCCQGFLLWLVASLASQAVAKTLNLHPFSAEERHWTAQQSLASLTALQTDAMVNQRLEETASGAPFWETLPQYYSDELMAFVLTVALIALFAWRACAAQRQAIRSAQSKSKSDFLSVVSHECRTSMHAILASVELLRRSPLDGRQQELITVAGSAADALLVLLDDVLDLSKLEAQRLALKRIPTDMVALAETAIVPVTTHERQSVPAEPAGSVRHTTALPASSAAQSAPTILLVDDHASNRLVIQRQLEELGCEVVLAEDGPVALALLATRQVQLVLLDCHMPGQDGYQVAREIRKREAGSECRTPVVAISAAVDPEHVQRCYDAGMDDVLKKPVRLAGLQHLIEAMCDVDLSLSVDAAASAAPDPNIDVHLKIMFRDSAKLNLTRMHQALKLDDRRMTAACVHRMKGAATMFGLSTMVEACEKFEYILQIGQSPNVTYITPLDSAYAELRSQVARVMPAMR